MLSTKKKKVVIEKHKVHDKDTGSPEVQVGLLSEKIEALTKHLKKNPKDHHSRRGLLKMVADRRTILAYVQKKSKTRHEAVVKKVGLKK